MNLALITLPPEISEGDLLELHEMLRLRLLVAVDSEWIDSLLIFELWDDLKAVRRRLGIKENDKL